MPENAKLIQSLQTSWRKEKAGAETYRRLASREPDEKQRAILLKLAEAEEEHAKKWELRLKELGAAPPKKIESSFEKLRRWLLVRSGTANAVQRLEEQEDRDTDRYEIGHALGEGILIDKILNGQFVLQKPPDGNAGALLDDRWDDGIDARPILQVGIHRGMLVIHIASKRVDDVVEGQAQLKLAFILCVRQEHLPLLFDEDLARAIDHDLADLRIIEKRIHDAITRGVCKDLVEEFLLARSEGAVCILVRLKNQSFQKLLIALSQGGSFIHQLHKVFQDPGS